jgi:hypothetical protein
MPKISYIWFMEWLYILGLVAYYLYKAYNKGIDGATDKNNKKPIQPIDKRKPEKTFEEIFKELMEKNTQEKKIGNPQDIKKENKQVLKSENKTDDVKVLQQKKKTENKEVFKNKPIQNQSTIVKNRREDSILHKHKDFSSSIEYDDKIENILHGKYDSIEQNDAFAISKMNNEIGDHKKAEYQTKMIKIKNRTLNPKDLVVAQILFERKYA